MEHSADVTALTAELRHSFADWAAGPEPWSESRLSAYARRAFAIQYRGIRPYRLYCERLGVSPAEVSDWREVPPVPTAAFREVQLSVGPDCLKPTDTPEAVLFRTSGTTRGRSRRGSHRVTDTALYRASMESGFLRHFLDGPSRVPICSLIPSFPDADDSSLSWMCDAVMESFGAEGSVCVAGAKGIDWDTADAFAEDAGRAEAPVCILATTLALDAWTRRLESRGMSLDLPRGSRIMDTGGVKDGSGPARSHTVRRATERLGVPARLVINEFGMTELLSQRYSRPARTDRYPAEPERSIAGQGVSGGRGVSGGADVLLLYGPPWLRTRALDPVTLAPQPDGEPGVLCHFDLANLRSVCAVLTEDLGKVRGNVVEWIGRTPGAVPRGCSLATAELLEAQADV